MKFSKTFAVVLMNTVACTEFAMAGSVNIHNLDIPANIGGHLTHATLTLEGIPAFGLPAVGQDATHPVPNGVYNHIKLLVSSQTHGPMVDQCNHNPITVDENTVLAISVSYKQDEPDHNKALLCTFVNE